MKSGANSVFNNKEGLRHEYLAELQSLRGLAVILVFLFHWHGVSFGLGAKPQVVSLLYSFVASGSTGVTLFFVLSGFLLSLPIMKGKKGSLPVFLKGRALRILPLYWFVLALALYVTGDFDSILRAFFFLPIGFGAFPFGVVLWTLVTEVQFYISLAVVIVLANKSWGRWVLFFVLFVLMASYAYLFIIGHAESMSPSYWLTKSLLGQWPSFAIGILSAYIFINYTLINSKIIGAILVSVSLLIMSFVLQKGALIPDSIQDIFWHEHYVFEAVLWAVILLTLLSTNFYGKRLLDNNFMRFIGRISYSMYLLHLPVIFYIIAALKRNIGSSEYVESYSYLGLLLTFIVTLALSAASYACIERPFLKLK